MKKSIENLNLNLRKGTLSSLFGEKSSLLMGILNCAIATGLCYASSLDRNFISFAGLFIVLGVARLALFYCYKQVGDDKMSEPALRKWEIWCISSGTLSALAVGAFSFYALLFTTDGFAQLTAVTVAIANTVGIAARNFGSRRYVLFQSLGIGVPLTAGLVLFGDVVHWGLAALYVTHMLAIVVMATKLRDVLHTALRRESEISNIADDLGVALETMPAGILMFDEDDMLRLSNSEARDILLLDDRPEKMDYSVREILERLNEIFSLSPETVRQLTTSFLETKQRRSAEPVIVRHQGYKSYKVLMRANNEGSLVVRVDDITDEENANARILTMARYDTLTNLSNRSWFLEQTSHLFDALNEHQSLVVATIDLDDFKAINDRHGHRIGDAVLMHVSKQLEQVLRPDDICARFDGDEFVIAMIVNETSHSTLVKIAQGLAERVNQSLRFDTTTIDLNASVGLAVQENKSQNVDELIVRADNALCAAKQNSESNYAIFEKEMRIALLREQSVKTELKRAVEEGKLTTMYQPLVDAQTGLVSDVEALCRWQHPSLGVVGPDEFIPIAEEIGLIGQITRQQMINACLTCAKLPGSVGVSVNLSAVDFKSGNLLADIHRALNVSGLAPSRLTVEVTETSLLDLNPKTLSMLHEIRGMGILVALDDFGVGYSSLSYLHKLPLDRLKIDRSFVMQIDEGPKTLKLLGAIGRMAEDLDMEVVVEGIETVEQMETIRATVQTSLFQGYLFSPPLSEASLAEYCDRTLSKKSSTQRQATA